MSLLYGADEDVAKWVSGQLGGVEFTPYKAIGVLSGQKLIAGVVYSDYHEAPDGRPLYIEMTIASVDKSWCSRHNLSALFKYPFKQLRLPRVQALCSAHDEGVQMFLQRLGFVREGYHPLARHDGDAISFGMLKNHCKWINHG